MRIISDGHYNIEEHGEIDGCYLLNRDGWCVGGITQEFPTEIYVATINVPWTEETDVEVVYRGNDLSRAICELWESRGEAV